MDLREPAAVSLRLSQIPVHSLNDPSSGDSLTAQLQVGEEVEQSVVDAAEVPDEAAAGGNCIGGRCVSELFAELVVAIAQGQDGIGECGRPGCVGRRARPWRVSRLAAWLLGEQVVQVR